MKAVEGYDGAGSDGPYTGQLLVDGVLVEDFDGFGEETETFEISTAGVPDGETLVVEVILENGDSSHLTLPYLLDRITGIAEPGPSVDWSLVKRLY